MAIFQYAYAYVLPCISSGWSPGQARLDRERGSGDGIVVVVAVVVIIINSSSRVVRNDRNSAVGLPAHAFALIRGARPPARARPSVRPSVQHERFSIARIMTTNRPRPCMPARSLAPRPCGLLVQGEASHKRVPAAPADSIKSLFNSASDKAQALNRNSVFANPSFLFTGCNS